MAIGSVGGDYNVPGWQPGKAGEAVKSEVRTPPVVGAEGQSTDYGDTVDVSEEARALIASAESSTTQKESKINGTASTAGSQKSDTERYDSYLKELRSQYTEEEAMSRFNEFMKSEGFEIQEQMDDPLVVKQFHGLTSRPHIDFRFGMANDPRFIAKRMGMEVPEWVHSDVEAFSRNFTYSRINGTPTQDGMKYQTGTYEVYNAFNWKDFGETVEAFKYRNVDSLSKECGFDVKEYTDNLSSEFGNSFSAEAVSADLGQTLQSILKQAGYSLEKGQELSLSYDTNGSRDIVGLVVNTNFGDESGKSDLQSAIDKALRSDKSLLQKFIHEDERGDPLDTTSLSETFESDTQRLSIHTYTNFIYSGSEPTALVTGSVMTAGAKGYYYQKKISDDYSPESHTAFHSTDIDIFNGDVKENLLRYFDGLNLS